MSLSRKVVKGTSPVGSAQWFKLIKADQKYNKYSVDLIVDDSEELQQMLNQIEELTQETIQETKKNMKDPQKAAKVKDSGNRPIEKQLDSNGQHTGKYILKFRGASSGKRKDESTYIVPAPTIFNNKAQPMSAVEKESLRVTNGSLIKVAYELSPYFVASLGAGVSLKPKAAMIMKLQEMADAGQFGFTASEMTSEDESDSEDFSAEKTESSDSDDF